MLTREENELLTRVGPGTPCGEMLRRYWHPVAIAQELTEEKPKLRVKILGEDLVLFRSANGNYGLVAEQCSHRGASLYYGFLEEESIRCPYHGWLYDSEGRCVEQPFEPQQSLLKHTIRHSAYPIQELGGLLFTYMGPPDKQPLLPRWDSLVRQDGTRGFEVPPILRCNWLQAEENTADSTHVLFLHHNYDAVRQGLKPGVDLSHGRPLERFGFQRFRWGITKSLFYGSDDPQILYERPLIFPNILRLGDMMHWRVPLDDTTTRIFWLTFRPSPDGSVVDPSIPPLMRNQKPWVGNDGEYTMDTTAGQDGMAWETQGPIYDRRKENLGASDTGVLMFRNLLKEQIEIVASGGEPIGLMWDPEENEMLDLWGTCIGVQGGTTRPAGPGRGRLPQGVPFDQVFDETHEVYEIPFGAARPAP